MEWISRDNKMTIILCAINVIVFLGLTMIGMTENATFMLEHGAMYVPYVLENQEYYRLFTSMFLHFGIEHLGNNMLLLFIMGTLLEKEMGSVKFTILYLLSGLGGNLLSLWGSLNSGSFAVSGGASGAVFGVIGGVLWVALRNKGRIGNVSSNGLIFMIGLSLYLGYTSTGIDNLAHLGGLLTGIIIAVGICRNRNRKS